ncbi:hypothetical protein [Silvibacterium acidisoli]|uniref:hypothetical protein n=1 Tax=Acidobacteriaceae bacterium ZG23-2 TaxID=2883246 RepID=UPI00406BE504
MSKPSGHIPEHPDSDSHKGAVESQTPTDHPKGEHGSDALASQLPHRDGSEFEGEDSDFPEPGSNPEHSGQHR